MINVAIVRKLEENNNFECNMENSEWMKFICGLDVDYKLFLIEGAMLSVFAPFFLASIEVRSAQTIWSLNTPDYYSHYSNWIFLCVCVFFSSFVSFYSTHFDSVPVSIHPVRIRCNSNQPTNNTLMNRTPKRKEDKIKRSHYQP